MAGVLPAVSVMWVSVGVGLYSQPSVACSIGREGGWGKSEVELSYQQECMQCAFPAQQLDARLHNFSQADASSSINTGSHVTLPCSWLSLPLPGTHA